MNITDATGLTPTQVATLKRLGAIDDGYQGEIVSQMKQALRKELAVVAAAWLLPFGVFLVQWLLWQGHRVQIHMMFKGA